LGSLEDDYFSRTSNRPLGIDNIAKGYGKYFKVAVKWNIWSEPNSDGAITGFRKDLWPAPHKQSVVESPDGVTWPEEGPVPLSSINFVDVPKPVQAVEDPCENAGSSSSSDSGSSSSSDSSSSSSAGSSSSSAAESSSSSSEKQPDVVINYGQAYDYPPGIFLSLLNSQISESSRFEGMLVHITGTKTTWQFTLNDEEYQNDNLIKDLETWSLVNQYGSTPVLTNISNFDDLMGLEQSIGTSPTPTYVEGVYVNVNSTIIKYTYEAGQWKDITPGVVVLDKINTTYLYQSPGAVISLPISATPTPTTSPTATPTPTTSPTATPTPTTSPTANPTPTTLPTATPTPTTSPTATPTPTTSPTATPTPTTSPTATPNAAYNTTITVPVGSNYVNGQGVTLVSTAGSSLSYNTLSNFSGTPVNIKVYVAGAQIALLTVTTPYIGLGFIIKKSTGEEYQGTFELDGRVDF
jgi:hypothetical protein